MYTQAVIQTFYCLWMTEKSYLWMKLQNDKNISQKFIHHVTYLQTGQKVNIFIGSQSQFYDVSLGVYSRGIKFIFHVAEAFTYMMII